MLVKPHKKLDVWKKSIDLVKGVYVLTKEYPHNEFYGLVTQMRRSSISVPANIAEGAARNTKKEFIQFLHMAQGSLSELDTHIEISLALAYVDEKGISELSSLMDAIDKMLTGLIKSLKRSSVAE